MSDEHISKVVAIMTNCKLNKEEFTNVVDFCKSIRDLAYMEQTEIINADRESWNRLLDTIKEYYPKKEKIIL